MGMQVLPGVLFKSKIKRKSLIKFKEILKETEFSDRKQRDAAVNVYYFILDYIQKNGEKSFSSLGQNSWKISSEDIKDLSDNYNFILTFDLVKNKKHRGGFQRGVKIIDKRTKTKIKIFVEKSKYSGSYDEKLLRAFKDKRRIFIHEFTHYLDSKRIPPSDKSYTKETDKDYFNDPRELNAYYQEAVGELMSRMKFNPDYLNDKAEEWESFVDFKDWFFKNMVDEHFVNHISDENEKSFIKRLYRFYSQTLSKFVDKSIS